MRTCIIYILLCFVGIPSVLGQELSKEEKERKRPPGVEEPGHRFIKSEGQVLEEFHIAPPFWWTGMNDPELEILVHDNKIANGEVSIDHPGIELKSVTRLANPNYLFLKLFIADECKAGTFEIRVQAAGEERVFPYELMQRIKDPARIAGLDPSDLIYLLMPDRFANGDPSNDSFDDMNQTGIDRRRMYYRHGGDIRGILNKLDYLEELGVTALWPNPLQENDQPYESYHGYAITDHYQVDKRFGDNEMYRALGDELQKRDMKLVIDLIFNHVGDQHWFIRDLPSEDWIHQHDHFIRTNYRAPALLDPYASEKDLKILSDGWFDHHMPDLDQLQPQLATYLIQNTIWWIEYAGVDGIRIDTYAYPDQGFMAEWARAVKAEYPQIGLFAETWVHGPAIQAQFTQHNGLRKVDPEMPAVTDFQLYYAINEALSRNQGWTEGAARIYFALAQDVLYEDPYRNVLHLDNHDLDRFVSRINENMAKFKSGIAFLLTMRGIPSLYYGTEIFMKNFKDPDGKVREEFPGGWPNDKVDKFRSEGRNAVEQEAFDFVQKLANYRKGQPALHRGKLKQFVPENGVYTYFRFDDNGTVMVVMNTHKDDADVKLERYSEMLTSFSSGRNVINNNNYTLSGSLFVPAYTTLILELE